MSTTTQHTSKTSASSSQASSAAHLSRSSTPPTEFSEALGSIHGDFELPPETDEMRQRREQSDRASSEIGKRLLQGWTMLGDECPNNSCYGVPLVQPRTTGATDHRKECVICGATYKTELDWAGREILFAYNGDTAPVSRALSPAPPTKRQRIPLRINSLDSNVDIPIRNKDNTERESKAHLTATGDALDGASEALQISLRALSLHLRHLSSCPVLDSTSIGMTADAIGKVAQTLSRMAEVRTAVN